MLKKLQELFVWKVHRNSNDRNSMNFIEIRYVKCKSKKKRYVSKLWINLQGFTANKYKHTQ